MCNVKISTLGYLWTDESQNTSQSSSELFFFAKGILRNYVIQSELQINLAFWYLAFNRLDRASDELSHFKILLAIGIWLLLFFLSLCFFNLSVDISTKCIRALDNTEIQFWFLLKLLRMFNRTMRTHLNSAFFDGYVTKFAVFIFTLLLKLLDFLLFWSY